MKKRILKKWTACVLAVMLTCIPFSVFAARGDLETADGRTAKDYLALKRYVLNTYDLTYSERAKADINGDGTVDAKDYLMLKRAVLGTFVLDNEPTVPENRSDTAQEILVQILTSVNNARAEHGLQPLTLSAELCIIAHDKSADMAQNGYFDHTSPIYGDPADMLDAYGVHYRASGENIAAGQQTAKEVMDAWMNSAGHRANILGASFTEMGIGLAYGGEYGIYWTMILCER